MTDTRIEPALAAASAETRALETQILEARGEITKLYRILLNSPAVCAGWEQLLTAIRQKTLLAPRLRELIVLRIAILNRTPYEFNSHISHARAAGITDAEIEAVRADMISGFGAMDQLVLTYTDAMTQDIQVPDILFSRVKVAFDPQGLVELTATIAAYNMVSRFLAALDVH